MNLKDGCFASRRSGCLIIGDLPDKAGRASKKGRLLKGEGELGDIQTRLSLRESCLGVGFYDKMRDSLRPVSTAGARS